MTSKCSPTTDFMVRLRKLDRAGLTVRDAVALWVIRGQPGMMGRELATTIGLKSRSNIQENIARLIRLGMIEDRRKAQNRLTPNDLYITPAGEQLLNDVIPE